MWVCEADGLHWAPTQGFTAAFRDHFDGQAAVEISGGFILMELCLVGFHQRIDESLILVFVHWAVEVSGALFFGFAFIIARLHPRLGHVDAVEIDDWGDSIKKGQGVCASVCCDGFAQITRGEGAGCNDPVAVCLQLFYLTVLNGNVWVCIYRISHCLGKVIAIHSQCAACRKAVFVCGLHNQTIGLAHFPVE